MSIETKVLAIIPCRYESTRFPGKPLAMIQKKPMMWWVYERARKASNIDQVIIATDDDRIVGECLKYNMDCLRTSSRNITGTDRVSEAAKECIADIYINIQGDEPAIDTKEVEKFVEETKLEIGKGYHVTNAYSKIEKCKEIFDTNVVKVVINEKNEALYYSRNTVPYFRFEEQNYFKQIGIYGFSKQGINIFGENKKSKNESCDDVELLRCLDKGTSVKMIKLKHWGKAVDHPADLAIVEKLLV